MLLFLHIPRTGGSTLKEALRQRLGPSARSLGNYYKDAVRTTEALDAAAHDPELLVLYGHAPIDVVDRHLPGATLVTIVRDPVERTISQYRHYVENEVIPPFNLVRDEGLSLLECVRDGRFVLDNVQTRMLSGAREPFGNCPRSALETAKRNLAERFAVAGATERYDEAVAEVAALLGWDGIECERYNESAFRPKVSDLTAEELATIHAFNRLDTELHAFVLERLRPRSTAGAGGLIGVGLQCRGELE